MKSLTKKNNILLIPLKLIYYFFKGTLVLITIIPKYLLIGIHCLFSEKKQKELEMEDKIIPTIIIILSLTTYLICIFILSRWYVQSERNKKFASSLNNLTKIVQEEENNANKDKNQSNEYKALNKDIIQKINNNDFSNIDLNSYLKINSETVAWIQVNGTNISYPVVQHKDNSYYLEHDFYNRKTNIGWVFADYRDNFDEFNNNTIIYAHNLINRTMFGQLPYLLKEKWQSNKDNFYIKLSTTKENSVWQIFSVYKSEPITDYLQSKFNSKETYKKFIESLNSKTSYKFNTPATEEDKIITLSTCDDTGTKRIVVHAKLIKQETK